MGSGGVSAVGSQQACGYVVWCMRSWDDVVQSADKGTRGGWLRAWVSCQLQQLCVVGSLADRAPSHIKDSTRTH